jgi:hypothetical protein
MALARRSVLATLFFALALCAPAQAASSMQVFVDNPSIALGGVTTFAAHTDTDADFHGGHAYFKYRGADSDCAATPQDDPGNIGTEQPIAVGAGPGATDLGGLPVQLDVGNLVICGWILDDTTGAVLAQGYTVVQVIPYQGSISVLIKKSAIGYQLTLAYSTSEAARLYVTVQQKACPISPTRIPKRALLVVPRGGRFVGSDGGMGKSIAKGQLTAGRWNVCAWLKADDGSVGPVVKRFSVPRAKKKRRASRVAG